MRQCLLIAILAFALHGCHTDCCQTETEPASVTDTTGRTHTILALRYNPTVPDSKGSLFFFITTQCPIANSYAPEIERITREYASRGVTTYLVHCDPDVTAAIAAQHAKEYGLTATVLLDHEHLLADALGATITPEAAVVSSGKLHYLGRIDDRYVDFGVNREVITQRNLRDALDAVIAGREVAQPRVAAVGCYISRD
jgi:hypothetical protein